MSKPSNEYLLQCLETGKDPEGMIEIERTATRPWQIAFSGIPDRKGQVFWCLTAFRTGKTGDVMSDYEKLSETVIEVLGLEPLPWLSALKLLHVPDVQTEDELREALAGRVTWVKTFGVRANIEVEEGVTQRTIRNRLRRKVRAMLEARGVELGEEE